MPASKNHPLKPDENVEYPENPSKEYGRKYPKWIAHARVQVFFTNSKNPEHALNIIIACIMKAN